MAKLSRRSVLTVLAAMFACAAVAACARSASARGDGAEIPVTGTPVGTPWASNTGSLLVIGGAIEKDNRPVFERFIELATRGGTEPAHIVIATAASGDPQASGDSAKETLSRYAPAGAEITIVHAATDEAATVAAFDRATGVYFTGGDQSRITARYRPGAADSSARGSATLPEYSALRGVLARGGVIAGTSAGAAMMGEVMFTGGSSAEALGVAKERKGKDGDPEEVRESADDAKERADASPSGPRLAPGMGLVNGILTDSHFFERDRVGRLVAALELGASRDWGMAGYGLGVAENACVEIDLAKRELRGVSEAPSLMVDARRSGLGVGAKARAEGYGPARSVMALPVHGCVARLIRQGEKINLTEQEGARDQRGEAESRQNEWPFNTARREGEATALPRGEKERKSRRGSSGALFLMATRESNKVWRLDLDGWGIEARGCVRNDTPDPFSWIIFDLVKGD